jgi:arginine decarboxylase
MPLHLQCHRGIINISICPRISITPHRCRRRCAAFREEQDGQDAACDTPLVDAIVERGSRSSEVPFHVPGHKRGSRVSSVHLSFLNEGAWQCDTTELTGLDNLQKPEGVIKEAMDAASKLWRCEHTWFLVNGATVGIQAAIMATCHRGSRDCIIVARNAHQSAHHGVILSGCNVVYVMPECGGGMAHHVTPASLEETFLCARENGRYPRAVLVVSPTYFGVQSDISALKAVCDRYNAVIIVDEAHGAHLDFLSAGNASALQSGAHLVIQSTHKQLSSLTQSSMLHAQNISSDLKNRIDRILRILQTSSPSYLLMASLDAARASMENASRAVWEPHEAALRTRAYFGECGGRLHCPACGMSLMILDVEGAAMDPWRITVVIEPCPQPNKANPSHSVPTGWSVSSLLETKRGIVAEMATQNSVVFAFSIGTTMEDADALISAMEWLRDLSEEQQLQELLGAAAPLSDSISHRDSDIPMPIHNNRPLVTTSPPREAFLADSEPVSLHCAAGRISCETITVYPPGIPIVCIGDIITSESINDIHQSVVNQATITGAIDDTLQTIHVVAGTVGDGLPINDF